MVDEPLTAHALSRACFFDQIGDTELDDTGTHSSLHVLTAALLHDHVVDPLARKELSE
jgi:hypothetical protein